MVAALLLAAALGSGSVILPASPEGVAIGDVNADSSNEIVLLLVWPSWSSMAVSTSPSPGYYEVVVKPAIEDRRELWVLRAENGRLERIAEPLTVGREVLAVGPLYPAGPVVVLDDSGVSRVVLGHDDSGRAVAKLERIASLRPLMAGINSPLGTFPLLSRLRPDDPPRISVPVARGMAFLDQGGNRLDVESPFREVKSGAWGRIGFPLPRRIDLDGDGRFDLLSIDRSDSRAALQRALPDGSFAAPVAWDLRPLVRPNPGETPLENRADDRKLVDVLDSDGDGVLEAVVAVQKTGGTGIREGMKLMRGVPGEYLFFALGGDGTVAKEPAVRASIVGHAADFDHPERWVSPFRDLDGDGRPELITITVDVGYLGVAKGLATKKMKMGWVFHVYRRDKTEWREVSEAAPRLEIATDLSDLEVSRFAQLPGDLDGDGRADMVQVTGSEVEIHAGLPGARFSDRPTRVVRFENKIRDFLGLVFVDLDGDRRSELIAFEELPQEADRPAREVRMVVQAIGGDAGEKQ